jgi:hypothetical protein
MFMIGVAIIFVMFITQNMIMMLISSLAMTLVIISVAAWLGLLEWEYGVIELVSMFFVTGFPLDLVMRAAYAYKKSPLETRNEKIQMV